jgi:hypothetical protein
MAARKRIASAAVAIVVVGQAVSAGAAVAAWRVVGSATSSGQFAVAAANGTARHPRQLAVRVIGGGSKVSGMAVVSCSRGLGSLGSSTTNIRGKMTTLKLPMRNADSCEIIASMSGSGYPKVQILAR